MKINARSGRPAFTLIELLAVITIIVILAALVVNGMSYVTDRQARERAKVQIALLSKALEDYKSDMGAYPSSANIPTVSSPKGSDNSAKLLYDALFYDGWNYIKSGSPANWTKATKIYLSDLDPNSTKQGWVETQTTGDPKPDLIVSDPWGNQYCYRTHVTGDSDGIPKPAKTDGTTELNQDTQNPDFDLWSMGKNGQSNAGNNPAGLKDPKNSDDVRNF